ncbi:amidohydrolase family protein [Archaeoglobus veneficus]|uniref:Amidohydrolase n=1 Tax=Archaeoglobus veneficus (strain DSM 11195 / SNP6) TaxID=693661 RepID=F2KMR1_ARCVS|nr:amidohydrolase family protein [Archaeoglobus veneficus]AEA46085.1 amidohydrolase [Archaeoglobus veneficus SNP6]
MNYACEFVTPERTVRGVLIAGEELIFEERDVQPEYIVCPSFFNAHTHLGDSVAKDPPFGGIDIVAPNGYKFRMLERFKDECTEAMAESIDLAFKSGCTGVMDFREGGVEGIEMLKKADKRGICVGLSRPSSLEEAEKLVDISDGFGISSVRDVGKAFAEELREIAAKKGKIFAIHAGEVDSQDVDDALALEPDILVHMNMATAEQLRRAMDEGIPIVSCVRSNAFFNVLNPKNYEILASYDRWLVGTDNVMLATPSILDELSFASYVLKNDEALFRAATRKPFSRTGVVVFHKKLNLARVRNPLASIVRRACMADIEAVLAGSLNFE